MSQTDLTIFVFAYLIVLAQGIFLFIDAKNGIVWHGCGELSD